MTLQARRGIIATFLICSGTLIAGGPPADASFRWPAGKRAAISLTYDDARRSQIDVLLPVLDKHGVKATFYVSPGEVPSRLEGWKQAVASGHEIGNHLRTHPCTGNYPFSFEKALENFTLDGIGQELDGANADIMRLLGVKAVDFAYPCGQKFVGRGTGVKSYVPLVAERFLSGRGYRDEGPNDPRICDLAQLTGMEMDELDEKQTMAVVRAAVQQGTWLVFVSHEVGAPAFQTTDPAVIETVFKFAKDPANGVWIDTVRAIGEYVNKQRGGR